MTDIREKTVEEQIAEIIKAWSKNETRYISYDVGYGNPVSHQDLAGLIAAIPKIKEGQKLLEKAESGKLVELDEDQSWPPLFILRNPVGALVQRLCLSAIRQAGFRRVRVKG